MNLPQISETKELPKLQFFSFQAVTACWFSVGLGSLFPLLTKILGISDYSNRSLVQCITT